MDRSAKGNSSHVVNSDYKLYDWTSHLSSSFSAVPQLLSYQKFVITKDVVNVSAFHGYPAKEICIIKRQPPYSQPQTIPLKGLDLQRQWYLYEQIREFCREGTEDLVAPKPKTAKGN